jgi:hypothetical protein
MMMALLFFVLSEDCKKPKIKKILRWSFYTISLGFAVSLIIIWNAFAIAEISFFLFGLCICKKKETKMIKILGAIGAVICFAVLYISFTYGAVTYIKNIKELEDIKVVSSTNIKINCVSDTISVTETKDNYNYMEETEDGGVIFSTIPLDTEKEYITDIRDSHIEKIVEEHQMINYNSTPPQKYGDTWVTTRYVLYIPEGSIYIENKRVE